MQTSKIDNNRLGRTAAFAFAAACATIANASYQTYQIIDLGTLSGGTYCKAYGVNNLGNVVGIADNSAGRARGFYWSNGVFQTIAPDASGDVGAGQMALDSRALALNDSNQVVGYRDHWYASAGYNVDRAFRWTVGGTIHNIANFANAYPFESVATGINNLGTVVGYANGQGGWPNGSQIPQAFRWTQAGGTQYMGSLTGSSSSQCYGQDINSQANICGYGQNAQNNYRSFRSNGANLIDMGGFPNPLIFEPPLESFGQAINDNNTVAGYYKLSSSRFNAFVKTANGAYEDLGLLPGSNVLDDSAQAYGINGTGEVVGSCEVGNANHRAFIYESVGGNWQMSDLNSRIPAGSGWVLEHAMDISNTGYIVGYGKKNGQVRAFLLKPSIAVSGQITLQDFDANPSGYWASIEVRDSANGQLLETQWLTLGPNGSYSFTTNKVGNRYLVAKVWHWLSKKTGTMNLTNNWSGVNFSLKNGDVDTDNEVSIMDYGIFSSAFGSSPGSGNWVASADLNGDLGVDIGDYAILSMNFGLLGDE
ncbi:MAG TPA: DUF3466 family protein [Fimbriimonadaceae bacterium]|nr:DUF3466 family protein [Fimbriimonadaceae bacterium]HRJ96427.1 DUF3466 family protein [Fimbriimonadaceae bacterium]